MKRSDVYWCRLEPVKGSEMGKTRPCVIVSLDSLNEVLPTVVVCPLTSIQRLKWRTRIPITFEGRRADVCAEQIRVISKDRLVDRIGKLRLADASALHDLLGEMYGST